MRADSLPNFPSLCSEEAGGRLEGGGAGSAVRSTRPARSPRAPPPGRSPHPGPARTPARGRSGRPGRGREGAPLTRSSRGVRRARVKVTSGRRTVRGSRAARPSSAVTPASRPQLSAGRGAGSFRASRAPGWVSAATSGLLATKRERGRRGEQRAGARPPLPWPQNWKFHPEPGRAGVSLRSKQPPTPDRTVPALPARGRSSAPTQSPGQSWGEGGHKVRPERRLALGAQQARASPSIPSAHRGLGSRLEEGLPSVPVRG